MVPQKELLATAKFPISAQLEEQRDESYEDGEGCSSQNQVLQSGRAFLSMAFWS
jgi:hypothetical protein